MEIWIEEYKWEDTMKYSHHKIKKISFEDVKNYFSEYELKTCDQRKGILKYLNSSGVWGFGRNNKQFGIFCFDIIEETNSSSSYLKNPNLMNLYNKYIINKQRKEKLKKLELC
jgi:hypothetical protein